MILRLSRAVLSRPLKPAFPTLVHELPQINKNAQIYAKHPTRYYLFPSVYRSFFSPYRATIGPYQESLANLMPFRNALHEIKRRLFFAGSSLRSFSCWRICISLRSRLLYMLESNEKQRAREQEEFGSCPLVRLH